MRRLLALAGCALAATLAIACESIIGVDYSDKHLATCQHAEPPGPPGGGDTGSAVSFTSVVYTIDWGDDSDSAGNPRALTIGYDDDDRCTSLLDAPACEPASWTAATMVDGPGGIDNGVGMLLYDQGTYFGLKPFTSSFLTESTQSGQQAPPGIIRVTGYSGYAIDAQVTVEWFVPVAPGVKPKWDGTDSWPILNGTADPTSGGGIVSHFIDRSAFVTNYHLVAHLPVGAPVVISDVPFKTVSMIVTADLVLPAAGQWQLQNGIAAGVGLQSELFDELGALTASFAGTSDAGIPNAICRNETALYAKIKTWLCSHADVLRGSGPACDASSFGMGFTARPGRVGAIAPAAPPVMYCMPGDDPAGDTCATPPPH
ncbi:MAG TPA: hypothetical protein VF765_04500 [Polyangiaceae bacterium]